MLRILTIYLFVFSPVVLSTPQQALDRSSGDDLFAAALMHSQSHVTQEPRLQLAQRKAGEFRYGKRSKRLAAQSELTLNEAIAIAKARVPGELVSASRKTSGNGQAVYHVKILTRKGVVRTVRVPAGAG